MDTSTCETCGNYYERSIVIQTADGGRHVFDCFECAITKLAPTCPHCSCRIIGHGVEDDGQIFCCASCVRMAHPDLGSSTDCDSDEAEDKRATVAAAQSFPASDPPSY